MIVLDTNVVSELARQTPDDRVLAWLDDQDEVAVTATTVAELLYGIAGLPDGAVKSRLAEGIRAIIDDELGGQVIVFDRAAASHHAEIVAGRDRMGRPRSIADGQIAATCWVHGAMLATRNVRDFEGVGINVVNPWNV